MQSQAEEYQSRLLNSNNYNKEEKMLHNANQVLKVEEEFNQYDLLKMKVTEDWTILQRGVFMRQAASDAGGAPCTGKILDYAKNISGIARTPECEVYFGDYDKKITR